ncbi:MAG: nucleotidyltransferase family protein, partial [Oscillospiraceae bacterium]|nr:nucleotidyltransferase family protein [Oscillospiraceae bacterium]
MKTVGIAAEYNPFHRGHACQLSACRRMLGEDAVFAAVMSGDFVQRGEAAMFSKFARAEAACRCGADLVIELPLPWALSSAEGFARGAVGLLGGLGATHLGFGSETGETAVLQELSGMPIGKWKLTERVDVNGNRVLYSYERTDYADGTNLGVEILLRDIFYTDKSGDSSSSPPYWIEFGYKLRTDKQLSVNTGVP